ncbi:MFS transporter [Azospirillum sp. RWY-5-1]|uniref:MFS transporter n=1 Tax=Azospirillum oleiclasticum TaxID=2735135 RepID=A0ABX2TI61_9PROT|nr:MFS transporter [Azospirillum oleiclasticum]NYZ16425.1 MFS transporter [Azospirillum oleiclasticum]NYZ23859.1 MFS transporter [Azospirillum oleiclasticum]
MSLPVAAQATAIPAFFARRGVHYGWVVAGVTFLTMLVTAGAVGTPGVLIGPLQQEFGWSTSEISSAFAVRLVLFGLLGPFAAAFMNRFGVRPVAATALALIGAGVLGSFAMTTLWQLFLLWGVVVGFGTGLTAMVLGATVATRWFSARRGLVVGLLTASTATGQLVFLPLLASLTQSIGWRSALALVLVMLLVAAVAVLVLMRDRPADVGLAPYGSTTVVPGPAALALGAMLASPIVALRDAARTRTFWVLFGTFFICGASTNGLVQTHFVPLCGDFGILPVAAAGMLAVIGVFDFAGTVGSGWLSDRFDSRKLLFWYYGLRGLSLVYLPFTSFNVYELSIFAVFYGLDWVATVPPTVKIAADRFGERANLVFGWVFAGHQLGAAFAAWGGGFTRTAYDSYLPAFFIAGLLCLVAALAVVTIHERRPAPLPAAA